MTDARRWAVIESASNQRFVFDSNRRRQNIGASELIRRVGEQWVREAIDAVAPGRIEIVVAASGRALLLGSADDLRAVVRAVTRRALVEAPGLMVWGTIASRVIGDEHPGESLDRLYREHAAGRAHLRGPEAREPRLPILAADSFYGTPVARVERRHGSLEQLGRRALACEGAAAEARQRMADRIERELSALGADPSSLEAVLTERSLQRGADVVQDGRVGIVHADGNGIGQLLLALNRLDGALFTERYRMLSEALDRITWSSLAQAITETHALLNADGRRPVAEWILPVLIGGDDVTVIVAGRAAYRFTIAFLRAFESQAAAHDGITALLEELRGAGAEGVPARVTASAGLAAVDSHHPFSHGYELSAALCASAKARQRALSPDDDRSTLDVHVLFESSLRDLEGIREPLHLDQHGNRRALWSPPLVVSRAGDPGDDTALAPTTNAMDGLLAQMTRGEGGSRAALPSGAVRRMRAALLESPETLSRELDAVVANAEDGVLMKQVLADQGLGAPADGSGTERERPPVLLLTAIDLVDLSEGVAR